LGERALRVALVIGAHANKDGQAYPGLSRIASITNIDKRGLYREINAIKRAGLIRIEHRFHPSGEAASNRYWLNFDEQVSSEETTPPAPPELVSSREATGAAQRSDTVPPPETIPVARRGDRRESRTDILIVKETEGAASHESVASSVTWGAEREVDSLFLKTGDLPSLGRSAPSASAPWCHTKSTGIPASGGVIHDTGAYEAEAKARKRANWLRSISAYVAKAYSPDASWPIWELMNKASQCWEELSKAEHGELDRLDKLMRQWRKETGQCRRRDRSL
jgi:hypothetical protein